MTRRIEEIQQIHFAGLRAIIHRHRMCFNCNPALALEVHRIEQLVLLVALVNRPRRLEQSVRQSCFAVIDVRDDAEIARQFDSHESRTMRARGYGVNCTAVLSFRPKWRNLLLLSETFRDVSTSLDMTEQIRSTSCR